MQAIKIACENEKKVVTLQRIDKYQPTCKQNEVNTYNNIDIHFQHLYCL